MATYWFKRCSALPKCVHPATKALAFKARWLGGTANRWKGVTLEAVDFFVYHYGPNLYSSWEAETSAGGNFRLSLPKGYYTIRLERSGGVHLGYYGGGGFVRNESAVIPLEVSGAGVTGIKIIIP